MSSNENELLFFNGINGSTGEYLVPPMRADQVAAVARGESFAPDHLMELQWRTSKNEQHYGVKEGVDPTDLAQAGWGVIFAADADPHVRDALRELLDYRKEQANRNKELYRELSGANGFRMGDTKNLFLARQRVGPGAVDPSKMPYYLLIVGDPETIPYSFQYQLDVAYAVGRIHFDTVEEYSQYAHSVVTSEKNNRALPPRAVFFGTQNPDDDSTRLSSERLVKPLAEKIKAEQTDWQVDSVVGEAATKPRLEAYLGGADTPALLFTAGHGLGFDLGDPRQLKQQGALVTQDWPGPNQGKGQPLTDKWYYASDDVPSDARVAGMVVFQFACFGAGTPKQDDFAHLRQGARERTQIAPASFVAKLPKRLLAHPKGGALAVIGHVDRTWGASFFWGASVEQRVVFESTLASLMAGHPVGFATEYFNERYAELATMLSGELEEIKVGKQANAQDLASLWAANNDARGYAVIGDPAVRLRVGGDQSNPTPVVQEIVVRAPTDTDVPRAKPAAMSSTQAQTVADATPPATDQARVIHAIDRLLINLQETTAALQELREALQAVRKEK